MKISKQDKVQYIGSSVIIVLFVIGWFIYNQLVVKKRENELELNKCYTDCLSKEIKTDKWGSYYIVYTIKVNKIIYENTASSLKTSEVQKVKKSAAPIKVAYQCDNPRNNNLVIPDK